MGWLYGIYIRRRIALLPDDHPHKPIQTNNKWENDDIRDILKVSLILKRSYDYLNSCVVARYQNVYISCYISRISFMVSGKRTALNSAVLETIICQKLELKRSVENKICCTENYLPSVNTKAGKKTPANVIICLDTCK